MTEEQKERSRQYQREYYQANKQERLEKIAEWKKKNPEKVKEHAKKYNKKYYATNKDRITQRRKELRRKMVEVTRCKDCKHRPTDPENKGVGQSLVFPDDVCPCQIGDNWYSWMPKDEWFCANAERREGRWN